MVVVVVVGGVEWVGTETKSLHKQPQNRLELVTESIPQNVAGTDVPPTHSLKIRLFHALR